MKLTISAGTKSISVELPEAEGRKQFRKIANMLAAAESTSSKPMTSALPKEFTDEPSMPTSPLCFEDEPVRPLMMQERYAAPPYTGFLLVKCPNCGSVKGLCAKAGINVYHCHECNTKSDLLPIFVPLYLNCECGRHYKYLTNVTETMFDVPCLNCGNPVAVQYNLKTGVYETMRERRRK